MTEKMNDRKTEHTGFTEEVDMLVNEEKQKLNTLESSILYNDPLLQKKLSEALQSVEKYEDFICIVVEGYGEIVIQETSIQYGDQTFSLKGSSKIGNLGERDLYIDIKKLAIGEDAWHLSLWHKKSNNKKVIMKPEKMDIKEVKNMLAKIILYDRKKNSGRIDIPMNHRVKKARLELVQ